MFSRRSFVVAIVAAGGLITWFASRKEPKPKKPIARAAPFVKPKEKWTADNFYMFLIALPTENMLELKKSLGLLNPEASAELLNGKEQDAREIQKRLLWLSTNIITYPFRDETKLDYHSLVSWVSSELGVAQGTVSSASTFAIERELLKVLFAQLWDKLSVAQRVELIAKADPHGAIKDKAAIAALGGAAAMAALSTTIAFTGFAFYATMSMTIAAVASALSATLPFSIYTGASATVGVLSGPIGWAFMAIATVGGVALAGRANVRKTTDLICQVHALKIAALEAAGVPENEVF